MSAAAAASGMMLPFASPSPPLAALPAPPFSKMARPRAATSSASLVSLASFSSSLSSAGGRPLFPLLRSCCAGEGARRGARAWNALAEAVVIEIVLFFVFLLSLFAF